MKPVEHSISDASFIGHYLKIIFTKLKQFKTAKHVVLISMVLICILTRYVVLSMDKGLVKIQAVTKKLQKVRTSVPKFSPNRSVSSQDNFLKFKQVKYNPIQTDAHYFLISEIQ